MKIIKNILILLVFLGSCSSPDEEQETEGLSERTLIGNWTATKFTVVSDGEKFDLNIGQQYCHTVDSSTLLFSGDCSDQDVDWCSTNEEFSIIFSEIGVYDRKEMNANQNPQINESNDCEITFSNDSFKSSAKGSWVLNVADEQIILEETYTFIEVVSSGEAREVERFDESEFIWRVLDLTDTEMIIFWRTPDQIDYEISFRKSQ